MKKEEVYVSVESKEQAEQYRKVLEAIGENVEGYEIEYFEHFNARQLGPRGSGGWWLSLDYEKPCKINQTVYKEISFGHLVDLLTENPKIAVRVENELEFRALMEFYESKGFKSIIGTPARYFKQGRFNNGELIKIFSFEDKFICPNDYGEKPETHGLHKFKILSFPEFAKQHGLKVPLLISEDGKVVYEGHKNLIVVSIDTKEIFDDKLHKHPVFGFSEDKYKFFTTIEAAEKWIESQKPKEKNISITPSINAECTKSGVIFSNDGNFLVQVSRDQLSDIAAAIVELNND